MAYVGSCKSGDKFCVVRFLSIFWVLTKIFFLQKFLFIKKLYGNHLGNQYIYLTCASSCEMFSGSRVCCQSNNCNTVDSEITFGSSFLVSQCNVGGSFSLTDSASSSYCPYLSSSYCGVGLFFI